MTAATRFEAAGRWFSIPTHPLTIGLDDRRVVALFTTGTPVERSDATEGMRFALTPEAADFSLVSQNRAAVLVEHNSRWLDGLVGIVEQCWFGADAGYALLRLGSNSAAEDILQKIADGLPVSISLGCDILDSRTEDGASGKPVIVVTRWRLREISFVTFGADRAARIIATGADAVAMAARHAAADQDRRIAVAETVLRAADWRRWATATGDALAARFGIVDPTFTATLYAATDQKIGALVGEMAEVRP